MARIGAEERRQDFIEATIKVIAEHGIANATTRRIAAAADSPLASLHYVFHTKEDLFYAVYESLINLPQQSLQQAPAGATPAETVGEMLRQLVKWFIAHPERAITQFELFFWNLRNDPEMAAKIYAVSIEATQQAIQKATGDALDHIAVATVSRLLLNLFDGLLLSWTAHGNPDRLEAETETACQAVELLVASY
ncbi:TPA: TetR/AcrR family transcriptional regulator [Pseudomonas aeruginosa]|jgi:AcrR family transcriptional regulator|uniref:TetR/AcrR family transcriptional regulator n=1 Tax=Pseudomonas TaxID=286 RepID=UPI00093BE73B|nr:MULTISPECIES: TetR/AcrR family transcriptional regulator [Pseudomonas]KAB0779244.1 TetR/AcrR family transcriptional regulator [Pseudomonas aeruginosa]MBG6404217.1 TetR/AcrR family transcriptional regulator [Pseudomonas aeruginosa]MBH4125906.1 TetR/AcrR family transcriptional regulator [Pseudomonas aeruginosa]MBH4248653.1 TetR/AcrR family transcriptional regulator [Pseudomonas aeruginosa]MBI7997279.1 TetR/AcrR family transcriptional regulator [Pseudomonas aeruginosa]